MAKPTPVFTGRVDDVCRLILDDKPRLFKWLATMAGKRVEVIVRRRQSQRSLDQNRWLWMADGMLAEHLGYDEHETDFVHYAMLAKRFGIRSDLGIDMPAKTSSQLTTAEFSDYMEWYVRQAATEFECQIPLPGEVDLGDYDEAPR